MEAPKSVKELERIGKTFRGVPQMTNMFEGDKETPWLTPKELRRLGFSMILYPTTLLFQVVRCTQEALRNLKAGKPAPKEARVDLSEYEQVVEMSRCAAIEMRFQRGRVSS